MGLLSALLGGVLGGLFLTGLIPIPVVGTLIGILLGTFVGAMGGELVGGKEIGRSALIGVWRRQGTCVRHPAEDDLRLRHPAHQPAGVDPLAE